MTKGIIALASVLAPQVASAATCTQVHLNGPFAPRELIKCVNGIDVYKITDPNSCPDGYKIWAPESREDWVTVINSGVLPVANPHMIIDVTRSENGCGSACRGIMNSDQPSKVSWHTSNGQKWWIRDREFHEPSGDYTANCFMSLGNWDNPDDIHVNDASCSLHSKDYLCQPIVKEDCTNRTDEITGPCKSEGALFRQSTCSAGVCEQGSYVAFKAKTGIEECQRLCEEGRNYTALPAGLVEKVYGFSQNGQFHDVSKMEPKVVRQGTKIDYPSTGGEVLPGTGLRDHLYVQFIGTLMIKTAGEYTFYTQSDDGSRLFINGEQIVNNGGWHGMRTRSGKVTLAAGPHDFLAESFEGGGGGGVRMHMKGPDTDGNKVYIESSFFRQDVEYELPGIFKTAGPCMAYSMTEDKQCLLYTDCKGVGTSGTCDAGLDFVGDLDSFKTCTYDAVQNPGAAAVV